jgi:hypothetical protein
MKKKYNSMKKGRCCSGAGMDDEEIIQVAQVLDEYQEKNILNANQKSLLRTYLLQQVPQSMTLYRGQQKTRQIKNTPFFSCSKYKSEALRFTGQNCCIFTIHVVDAQLLDVNEFLEHWIGTSLMEHEHEVLVLGGGKFYKDKEMTEEGFTQLEDRHRHPSMYNYFPHPEPPYEFECWYKSIEADV